MCLATLIFASSAAAQSYPAKPVRVIVPTAAGGGSDIQARLLAKAFHEAMGQPFVIENRPGASGTIGAEMAAKAPPDGYTLFLATALLATNAALYKKLAFDPVKDLAPIGQISFAPQFLIAHPSVPAALASAPVRHQKVVRSHEAPSAAFGRKSLGRPVTKWFSRRPTNE